MLKLPISLHLENPEGDLKEQELRFVFNSPGSLMHHTFANMIVAIKQARIPLGRICVICQHYNRGRSFSLQAIRWTSTSSMSQVKISSPAKFKVADRLTGRTSLITGGSSGIGYAVAERFLQEGARKVILVGRSHERLVDTARKLEDSGASTPIGKSEASSASSPLQNNILQWSVQPFSDKVSLLVGDISTAQDWVREMEKAMVRN